MKEFKDYLRKYLESDGTAAAAAESSDFKKYCGKARSNDPGENDKTALLALKEMMKSENAAGKTKLTIEEEEERIIEEADGLRQFMVRLFMAVLGTGVGVPFFPPAGG